MFSNGRYGNDKLNRALFIAALGFYILGFALVLILNVRSLATRLLQGAGLALLLLGILRMLSRNYPAREKELLWYGNFVNRLSAAGRRIKSFFTRLFGRTDKVINLEERRRYKHLTCPQCMQKLRVPRGKGTVLVTCTKCRCKFRAKT